MMTGVRLPDQVSVVIAMQHGLLCDEAEAENFDFFAERYGGLRHEEARSRIRQADAELRELAVDFWRALEGTHVDERRWDASVPAYGSDGREKARILFVCENVSPAAEQLEPRIVAVRKNISFR